MSAPRRLAAILAADVAGYSRLMGQDEAGTAQAVRESRDAATPIVASHGGRIVNTMGDGVLLEFPSVVAAVECAIAVQRLMFQRNAEVPEDKRIVYRIGVHLGDVLIDGDDILGDGVNIAARLEGVAKPGAICLSEDAYRQVKGRLSLAVNDLGSTQLKNIAEPVHVYSLEVGQPSPAKLAKPAEPVTPAASAPQKRRIGLPPPAAALVALVVVIAGGAWWFLNSNRPAPVTTNAPPPLATQRLSIVVLPFANLSGDPAQDYLVDALTDELTTSLARIPGTFVIARNTAFTYKGKPVDAKAIGKDLGVRYVLEGSVHPSGDRMRVNAQLIDAASGAHLWAEKFDTARADLLQMQDEIVTHLARAMEARLTEVEAARLKRAPVANPDAEDLALQCQAALDKAGYFGKEAEAGYPLCEQALGVDPNNVRALVNLATKFWAPVNLGASADPKADTRRADELLSQALALDPTAAGAHNGKAWNLRDQGRIEEAVAERELALVLDPVDVGVLQGLAWDHVYLGHFDKGLELFDQAIRLSPRDPELQFMYLGKSFTSFGLKQYDQTIDWARRGIAIGSSIPFPYQNLAAALALTGHEAEAREALQHYLALPSSERVRTIAATKEYNARLVSPNSDPRILDSLERLYEGLRKAGMPEE
jgi:TolB-like protein/class 3 adenylate cyclase/Tfp pilus assembly protein PilF